MEPKKDAPTVQLPPNALFPFDHLSNRYAAVVGEGVEPEHLLNPAFWAHQAVRLRPYDEIRVHAQDGTWLGYYVVLDCSRTWAKVKELALHRLSTTDVSLSEAEVQAFREAHKLVHRQQHKWSIVRKADNAVLAEGIEQKEDAQKELERIARQQLGIRAAQAVST